MGGGGGGEQQEARPRAWISPVWDAHLLEVVLQVCVPAAVHLHVLLCAGATVATGSGGVDDVAVTLLR